jgi:cell fate regulator YaaT (PSP1 superfamily)
MTEIQEDQPAAPSRHEPADVFYHIRFREDGQQFTAAASIAGLHRDTVVMVKTDHGLEPALIKNVAPPCMCSEKPRQASFEIVKELGQEDLERYTHLLEQEKHAFAACVSLIKKHELEMSLVRVERFFNGSKMIFFFTADNRVDFRNLVKDLVQEFRTRVEMRQVGVRHETKMLGGLGTCGRELCCSSFIKKFDSVSIKMAKEQDLPLNPSKISGLCNRLLCCLTYEYDTYRKQRKGMPKIGKKIKIGEEYFLVKRQNPLQESVVVSNEKGEDTLLQKDEWSVSESPRVEKNDKTEKAEKVGKREKKGRE